MPRLIDADALIAETKKNRCADCDRRKGIKRGKITFVYDFGEAPCRACDVGDMIDTLDEAPTAVGWISVENKLPEKNGDYLVVTSFFDRRRIEVLTFVQDLEKLDSYDFHGKRRQGFADYNSEYGFSERKVSHWMPLPEPPKEVSEDD